MTTSKQTVITMILGSTRKVSTGKNIGAVIKKIFADKYADIKVQEFTPLEPYNLLNEPINGLPPLMFNTQTNPEDINKYESEVVRAFSKAVESTDGFFFVLPVYNHSYPGGFKIMLDHIFHEMRDKPVYILAYGPSSPETAVTDTTKLVNKMHMKVVGSSVVKISYTDPEYLGAYADALDAAVASLAKAASHAE